MSKYALSATSKIPDDRIKITCKMCGRFSLCGIDEDPKSKKCGYCGHDFGTKIKFHVEDMPNASSETHNRYNWFCSKCEHRGLKWVEKTIDFIDCPHCNVPLSFFMTRQINPDKGSCKNIWDSEEAEFYQPPKLDIKASRTSGICCTCGNKYSYVVTPPFRCDNCGSNGDVFRKIKVKVQS
jgi:hypothetical protein